MRENRTYGSEGGEGKPFPTPIRVTEMSQHSLPMMYYIRCGALCLTRGFVPKTLS